jgi:hypothetical protein
MRARRRLGVIISTAAIGLTVYLVTNPYVGVHLFIHRELLRSNITNSTDMYHIGALGASIPNALRLIGAGMGWPLAVAAPMAVLAGLILMLKRGLRDKRAAPTEAPGDEARFIAKNVISAAMILAAPALLALLQFVALAAGKPGEYGRFAIFIDMTLAFCAVIGGAHLLAGWRLGAVLCAAMVCATAYFGGNYLLGFVRDCGVSTTRLRAAELIAKMRPPGVRIGLRAEPAPYCCPPIDLFDGPIVLLPSSGAAPGPEDQPTWVIVAADDPAALTTMRGYHRLVEATRCHPPAVISWADKSFEIFSRDRAGRGEAARGGAKN